jgi:DNA-binding PadR family transcriptional regulator
MVLRYGLLALLAEGPASGYDLSQRFREALSIVWPASHPQIYGELSRLVQDELIEVVDEGPRGRKAYGITPEGLGVVKEWLRSNEIDRTLRSESLFRSFFFWLMEPDELQKHLTAEYDFFIKQAEVYKQVGAAKDRSEYGDTPQIKSARLTVEAGARLYSALAEWAEWAKRKAKDLN